MRQIGVGLIGATPGQSWAMSSHIPALTGMESAACRLVAAGTSGAETAARASAAFGVPGYGDYRALIADPAVEVVTVSVRLPLHYEIVSAAIDAGKHVYCEWPLGRTLAEAEELAAKARSAGVRTMIGLQSNGSLVLRKFRELIAQGYVGEVLSVSALTSGFGWGEAIDPRNAYLYQRENGATLLTITGGHLIDALVSAHGEIDAVSAYLPTRRREVAVVSPEELAKVRSFAATVDFNKDGTDRAGVIHARDTFAPTSPDQVAITAQFADGVPLSVHIRGGALRSTGLLVEVIGTKGELRLSGPAGLIQMFPLKLEGGQGAQASLQPIETDTDAYDGLGPIASNISRMYARFAQDILSGEQTVPDFDYAVRHQRLMAAIERADISGSRETVRHS